MRSRSPPSVEEDGSLGKIMSMVVCMRDVRWMLSKMRTILYIMLWENCAADRMTISHRYRVQYVCTCTVASQWCCGADERRFSSRK